MKIMTITDNPNITTGLAKVHRNVIDGYLAAGLEVLPCIWHAHTNAAVSKSAKDKQPLPAITYKSESGSEIPMYAIPRMGQNAMIAAYEAILSLKPDVVVTIGDYWDFYYMHAIKKQLDFSFKWVAYLTIEEESIPEKFVPLLQFADAIAVPSLFGVESIKKADLKVQFIPYGTDNCFSACDPTSREVLRKARGLAESDVRVISCGQNTSRKYLPIIPLIASTLKSRDDYEGGIKFHIHTNISAMDQNEVFLFDLVSIAEKLDVCDMVSFPSSHSIYAGCPLNLLVDEFNSSDIFLLPSMSEGYCLPMLEAMACGLPVVSSPMTSSFEHVGAKSSPTKGDFIPFSLGERGILTAARLQVFPPDRLGRMMDPYDAATHLINMAKMIRKGDGVILQMSSACTRYAKERTWDRMKRDLVGLTLGVPKQVTIPVEDI